MSSGRDWRDPKSCTLSKSALRVFLDRRRQCGKLYSRGFASEEGWVVDPREEVLEKNQFE
jgi:hypothetical protein